MKSPNSKAKWITISANEIDIVSAQNGLGISSAQCIEELYRKGSTSALNCESGTPFSSSIIFELFSDNGADFYVKIRNNGKYVNLCGAKQTSCSYESWKAQAKQATVADPLSVCGKSSIELTPEANIVPSILLEWLYVWEFLASSLLGHDLKLLTFNFQTIFDWMVSNIDL